VKRIPNSQCSSFAVEWGRLLSRALEDELEVSWSEFFTFPRCILWSAQRGGRRVTKKAKFNDVVKARLVKWRDGCKQELWADVLQRSRKQLEDAPTEHKQRDGKRLEAAVISALRMGDVRKALQLLNSAPIAPKTEATLQRLKDLHPTGPLPEPLPKVSNLEDVPHFTDDLVRSALSTFGPGSAAGLFGVKPVLFQQATRAETYNFGCALTRACNYFARGRGPEFLRPLMAGGVSIALEKSQTAVRPLACGDPIRRLVAKCFCLGGKEAISKAFAGKNYGVGCKGGVEVVAHSLRDTLTKHKGSKMGLLKIDFKNAFNMISRNHFMKQAHEMFPYMSAWTEWCYGKPTVLLYDHEHVIWSESGVQQGDPLGPLYFCCGLNPLVNDIQALDPTYNKWYMDDGGIIGDVEFLKKVWKLLKERGPALGLILNPSKCEWSWLDPDCTEPCPIEGVAFVPHSEIQMLGVPLGCDEFVSGFVEKKLLGRLQKTVDSLVEFEDSQAASYLLRVSYSIVRAVHFMRTTPLEKWKLQAVQFDNMMRKAIQSILGFPMSDLAFAQACLTPKLGGLGLRRVAEHADLAYQASWHESQKKPRRLGSLHPECLPKQSISLRPLSSLTRRCTLG
jgi:hypothetical protein